jgi:hypothetical protein
MTAIMQMWPNAKIDEQDPVGVWSVAINDLSVEQIQFGIQQMSRLDREYALNPGQFRALVMESSTAAYRTRVQQQHHAEMKLPDADPEVARKALAESMALLGIRTGN